MESQQSFCSDRLASIPEGLRVKVIHHDDHIIVVFKPANLRSVPGHAVSGQKRPREEEKGTLSAGASDPSRRTGQEAWMEAIRSFAAQNSSDDEIDKYLARLGASERCLTSIPRKYKTFCRYMERNRHRIFESDDTKGFNPQHHGNGDQIQENVATSMFVRIEERQRPLLGLPDPTSLEESALGQLRLLGYADTDESRSNQQLFVVHRLDCETSGVMVFARQALGASFLSQAWRERDQVSKTYLAKVYDWPPWTREKQELGRIDLALAPSEERLKWKVCADGKPSSTLWKVLEGSKKGSHILLELQPITGRTHQLRIHCSTVGSGIVGDSLYGLGQAGLQRPGTEQRLSLHANKLCFPHPESKELVEFVADPDW
jgi:tRNA pseudouridine32 synthase/23S rRNA pseudouridine746 synthase